MKRSKLYDLGPDWVQQKMDEGNTASAIARELGIGVTTTCRFVQKHNLKRPILKFEDSGATVGWVKEKLEEGLNPLEIAKLKGFESKTPVLRFVYENNITLPEPKWHLLDKLASVEKIREKFEEGHSPAAIAEIYSVSENTVRRYLAHHGIERAGGREGKMYEIASSRKQEERSVREFNPPVEWVEEKLEEGWSLSKIAEECPLEWGNGYSRRAVKRFIIRHDIDYVPRKKLQVQDSPAFLNGHYGKLNKNGSPIYSPPIDWMVEQLKTKSYNEIAQEEGVVHSTIRDFVERSNLEAFREVKGHHLGNTNTRWWDEHDIISGTYWGKLKSGAKKRNIKFEITPDEAYQIYLKQDGKCIYTGTPIFFGPQRGNGVGDNPVKGNGSERQVQTASLDRVVSRIKVYRADNCQWTHATVNIMKNKLSEEAFLFWIDAIHSHSIKKCE